VLPVIERLLVLLVLPAEGVRLARARPPTEEGRVRLAEDYLEPPFGEVNRSGESSQSCADDDDHRALESLAAAGERGTRLTGLSRVVVYEREV
jgi:hypothetical protein